MGSVGGSYDGVSGGGVMMGLVGGGYGGVSGGKGGGGYDGVSGGRVNPNLENF